MEGYQLSYITTTLIFINSVEQKIVVQKANDTKYLTKKAKAISCAPKELTFPASYSTLVVISSYQIRCINQ